MRTRSRFVVYASGFALICAVTSAAKAQSPALITHAVDNSTRIALNGNVHPLARSEFDRGEAPAELPLDRLLLILKRSPERESALRRLIEEQQSVDSGVYHRWLTPAQFGQQFGAAESDIATITQWLAAGGFHVERVSNSLTFIEFSGTAGAIKAAFGTPIHKFAVNGEEHWANVAEPSVPSALAPAIAGINSLHNFRRQAQNVRVSPAAPNLDALAQYAPSLTFQSGQATEFVLVPYDFAAIYNLLPLWNATPTPINGLGQTIAIVARTDIHPEDTTGFWQAYGLDGTHAPQPRLILTYNGPNPGINGDEGEALIDTQWSGAVAPAATINMVISSSTETSDGVDLSALYIVDNNLAPVLSESYGACEAGMGAAGVQFYQSLWQQAAAQGISAIVSTGDNGSAGCDYPGAPASHGLAVNGIASTAFNAAVGGTDFNQFRTWTTYWNTTNDPVTQASAKGYIPETTWNDSCTNALLETLQGASTQPETNCNNANFSAFLNSIAGSGGSSTTSLKPGWQTGTPADNARDLPDISLFASNGFVGSYYLVCQNSLLVSCDGQRGGYGGTSVAAPAFAGIMALVNQKTGSAQGVPGLVLYKLASQKPTTFHDVPAGSTIAVPCKSGSANCTTALSGDQYGLLSGYSTGPGYDLATGLGSVDAAALVNNWSTISFSPSTTTLSVNAGSPVSVQHGTAVPFSIAVTPSAATGDAVLMVSPGKAGDRGIAAFGLSGGSVNASTSLLPGGSYQLMAHYGGNGTYGGSYSGAVPVTITPENSRMFADLVLISEGGSILSFSGAGGTYGSGFAILRFDVADSTATFSGASGITSTCIGGQSSCATGSVALTAPGTPLDKLSLPLNNKARAEYFPLVPGDYAISASYPGDASYGPSATTLNFTFAKAATTASADVAGLPVQYGNSEQIDAAIATTSTGVAPTGTFQFLIDGAPSGMPVSIYESNGYNPSMIGTTRYAWADAISRGIFSSVGNHTISVQYSGDANYASSTSPASPVTVSKAQPSVGSWGWATPDASIGQTVSPTASMRASDTGVAPTGTFTFFDNGVAILGTPTLAFQSPLLIATTTYTFTTAGSHALTFTYGGDANYLPASSPFPDAIIVAGPVSVSASGDISIAAPGQAGSTTLSVTPNNGFSGSVSLTCTPAATASESTCSLSSGTTSAATIQINVSGSASQVIMNVTTKPASSNAVKAVVRAGLAGLFLLCIPLLRRRRSRSYFLLASACLLLASVAACGGGSSGGGGGGGGGPTDPGTPAGTYVFTITAVTGTGSSAVTTVATVNVTVR